MTVVKNGTDAINCPVPPTRAGAVDAFRIILAILLLLIAPLIKKVTLLIDALDVNTAIA